MEQMDLGLVKYGRTVSTGNYGNVRAERVVPILVPEGASRAEVLAAEREARGTAMEQVHEAINRGMETEGKPAPFHDGPRYDVARWGADRSVIVIVPAGAEIPGGLSWKRKEGHRLPMARLLAARWVDMADDVSEALDLWDGEFSVLEARYATLQEKVLQEEQQVRAERDGDEYEDWDEYEE